MQWGFSAQCSQTFLHPADISAATDPAFVSAPMSWRISECAAVLFKHISIYPPPPPHTLFSLCSLLLLMSRWSSDMLTQAFVLTPLGLSLENILWPAAREQEILFSFSLSQFTRDQRTVSHCWTPELLYILLMNLQIVIQLYVNRKEGRPSSLCVCLSVCLTERGREEEAEWSEVQCNHDGFLAWVCSNW